MFRSHEAATDYKASMGLTSCSPPWVSEGPATRKLITILSEDLQLAVIVYDTVLSFPQEIKCIWGRKPGAGTILYLFVRYGTIIDMILEIFNGIYVPKTVSVSNIIPRDWTLLTLSFQR